MPRPFLIATAAAALLITAACSGSGDEDTSISGPPRACAADADNVVIRPSDAEYFPVIASSDLAVGENRFVAGLLKSADQTPVLGADLGFTFYCFDEDGERTDQFEADAEALTITKSITHTHDDGTVESHAAGEVGVHVANVMFPTAGKWGLEVTGTVDGEELAAQTVMFNVHEESFAPAIGESAPESVQPTLKDVADIKELDTSEKPIPEMHDQTIAEAVTSGKPTVIAFATPAFCVSQLCGPAKELVDALYQEYGERANFVHVEPYRLEEARAGKGLCPVPIMNVDYAANPPEGCPAIPASQLPPAEQSWGLSTEPWVFIVGSDGRIAAKFESAFGEKELEDALLTVLS